jgi:type I restriction enzyme S subunit
MKGMVSKSAFQAIELLVPPMERQQEFAARAAAIRRQAAVAREALEAHNLLFASLQTCAFRGEL